MLITHHSPLTTQPRTGSRGPRDGTHSSRLTPQALTPFGVPSDMAKKDAPINAEMLPITTSSESRPVAHPAFVDTTESRITEARKASSEKQDAAPKAEPAAHALPAHRSETSAPVASTRPPDSPSQDQFHMVEQIVRKLEALRLTHGEQRMTLHLQPEHLGDLRLTVAVEKDHVTAHILAESQIVRQAVEESKEQLRTALAQKGFTLDGLDVSLNHGSAERRFPSPLPESHLRPLPSARPILMPESEPSAPLTLVRVRGGYASGRLDYVA